MLLCPDMLNKLEEKTKVPVVYMVLGASAVLAVVFYFLVGMGFICDMVAFLPPAYLSFVAIEAAKPSAMKHLLQYWIVFCFVQLIELCGVAFLIGKYYYFAKLGFMVYCYHPEYKGAEQVYNLAIKPFMAKHKNQIDAAVNVVAKNVNKVSDAVESVNAVVKDVAAVSVAADAVPVAAGADTNEDHEKTN